MPPVILDWLDHIVSFVTAILTGLVCGWMAESFFTDNKQLIWTSVAMGGFVGHKGLTIVMDLFLEKLTDKIAKAELSDKDTKK